MVGHLVELVGGDGIADLPVEPGALRMGAPGGIETDDLSVLFHHLQPSADMHRRRHLDLALFQNALVFLVMEVWNEVRVLMQAASDTVTAKIPDRFETGLACGSFDRLADLVDPCTSACNDPSTAPDGLVKQLLLGENA